MGVGVGAATVGEISRLFLLGMVDVLVGLGVLVFVTGAVLHWKDQRHMDRLKKQIELQRGTQCPDNVLGKR